MPDEKTVKFECLHCKQLIEAPEELVGTIVECPSCGKMVKVVKKLNIPLASVELPREPEDKEYESDRIRGIADSFAMASKLVLILYCAVAAFVWIASISNEWTLGYWLIYGSGAVVLFSAWCYLMAQIIYIRAALEKHD